MAEAESRRSGGGAGGLMKSSVLMASGTLVSRVLGLVRVMLLGAAVGFGMPGNAWETANTLPNIIYLVLAGGVLNAVLVPQLSKAMEHEDGGQNFTDRLITLFLVVLAGMTVVAVAAAPLLVKLFGFSLSGEVFRLATIFALLCLPQVFFYGLYTLLGQVLNSREAFGAYMWSPALANLVGIAGLGIFLWAYPHQAPVEEWTMPMILVLSASFTLGVAAQALILLIPLYKLGFRYRFRWGFRGIGLKSVSAIAGWSFAIILLSQAGQVINTNVLNWASEQQEGIAGKFSNGQAFLLFMLPHSLISVSLVTALYPRMSRAAVKRDVLTLRQDFRQGVGLLGTMLIPVTAVLFVLAPSIADTLFISNDRSDTEPIGHIVMAMSLGLVGYGIYLLCTRLCYAYEDGRKAFILQVVITIANFLGALVTFLLVPYSSVAVGLGVSSAVGQVSAAVLGLGWARRWLGKLGGSRLIPTYVRSILAAIVATAAGFATVWVIGLVLSGKVESIVTACVGAVIILGVHFVVAGLLGVREIPEALAPVTRRMPPALREKARALGWVRSDVTESPLAGLSVELLPPHPADDLEIPHPELRRPTGRDNRVMPWD